MLKTINFRIAERMSQVLLALCLLATCAQGTSAQHSVAEPATSNSVPGPNPVPTRPTVVDSAKASQTTIDPSLPDDPGVLKMLEPYAAKVRALDIVIGRVDGELRKTGLGGGTLGNFVTDGIRAQASARLGKPIDLAVSNSGGLRKNVISPGNIRVRDIWELLPFENALVEVELTGDQVLKLLKVAVENREPQSGARVTYRTNEDKKNEFVSAVLVRADGSERAIAANGTYRVITIDYLLSVAGGKFSILQAAKLQRPLGVTIRDAMIDYVKSEAAAGRSIKAKLDGRFRREGNAQEGDPN